jgi:hypothetical protein
LSPAAKRVDERLLEGADVAALVVVEASCGVGARRSVDDREPRLPCFDQVADDPLTGSRVGLDVDEAVELLIGDSHRPEAVACLEMEHLKVDVEHGRALADLVDGEAERAERLGRLGWA